jgi:hypothetical protein
MSGDTGPGGDSGTGPGRAVRSILWGLLVAIAAAIARLHAPRHPF